VARFLLEYAHSKDLLLRSVFVNADHVHALIDLPTGMTIEEAAQLLKGASSHWINQDRVVAAKFSWGRGYGAFSVSESNVPKVVDYIAGQDEHHRTKSFQEEYEGFLRAVGIQPKEAENR
jgi:REP element-mobilizing transposase RayT